jgi:hypothetical protein
MSSFYTTNKIPNGSAWRATETVCGAMLEPLQPPDDKLAKVRFSKDVFAILKSKKLKGETIRQALERIIIEAS